MNDATLGGLFSAPSPAPSPVRVPNRYAAADAAAQAGMQQAEENANPDFLAAAADAVGVVANILETFTTDDVWEELERQGMSEATHNKSAIGPAMNRAIRAGVMEFAGCYRKSQRKTRHANQLHVWRSLLYKGAKGVQA